MRFKACFATLIACLFFAIPLLAQTDITGLWKGTIYHDSTQKTLSYEVGISDAGKGRLSGYSHTFFIIDDERYYGIKDIKIKEAKDGKIVIEDEELISNNYPIKPPKGIHAIYVLDLIITPDSMILKGGFETNRTKEYHKATGKVYLSRKNDFKQSALVPHLQELGLDNKLSFLPKEEETYIAKEERKIEAPKPVSIESNKQTEVEAINKPAVVKPAMPELKTEEPVIVKTEPKTETPKPQPVSKPAVPELKKDEPVIVKTQPKTETPKPQPVSKPAEEKPKPVAAEKKEVAVVKPIIQPKKEEIKKQAVVIAKQPEPAKPVAIIDKQPDPAKPAPVIAAAPKPQTKQNDFVAAANAAKNIAARKIETVQSLYFTSDSLEITLYDNGEVDGDTVSVLMNGRVIMANQGLSTKAIKKTIYTSDIKDSLQLIMYAESLGAIAPNTGLMIVYDAGKRHEIRFSGDMQKSAAIVFRRKGN